MNRIAHSRWFARTAMLILLVIGSSWVGWPVLDSLSAPSLDDARALTPWLLFLVTSLLMLVAAAVASAAPEGLSALAPVSVAVVLTVLVRLLFHPSAAGIEPAFALPLLIGVALGGVRGFLVGACSSLVTALVQGTVAEPLVAQTIVWGLWGLTGGIFTKWRTLTAWITAAVMCLPLSIISGVLLNLSGWTSITTPGPGSFLPGLGIVDSALRLWSYTVATSIGLDFARGISTSIAALIFGWPLITAMRKPATHPPQPSPEISPEALAARQRSRAVSSIWKDSDEHAHNR